MNITLQENKGGQQLAIESGSVGTKNYFPMNKNGCKNEGVGGIWVMPPTFLKIHKKCSFGKENGATSFGKLNKKGKYFSNLQKCPF